MTLKDETQKMECLLEALYPELFSGTRICSQTHLHYSDAIQRSERCKRFAATLKKRLAQIRGRLAPHPDKVALAHKLFIEVSSSVDLRYEALALIRACEEWPAEEEAVPAR